MAANNNLFDLSGKVALVTGGNSGLGLGFARGIAKQGGDVVIWGRNDEKNALAVEELQGYGVRASARPVDVSSQDEVIAGFDAVLEEYGRIDTVIANAGMPPNTRSILTTSAEDSTPCSIPTCTVPSTPCRRAPNAWSPAPRAASPAAP